MAIIKCPHCATEHDTKDYPSGGSDRIVKCRQCDFVFVTPDKAARILREEGSVASASDPDEPRTAISSGVATPAAIPDAPPLEVTLTATAGADAGKVWKEQKPLVFIGRRNADVILDDQEASRQHAVIELHGDHFVLKDLGSTNGTYLDDTKVSAADIRDGSKIRIGDTVLVVGIAEVGADVEPAEGA